jgi:hypothetical protein
VVVVFVRKEVSILRSTSVDGNYSLVDAKEVVLNGALRPMRT